MAARKPGFTLERHREFGKELAELHQRIMDHHIELNTAYSMRGEHVRHTKHMLNSLADLRMALFVSLCVENPQADRDALRKVYAVVDRDVDA